jgi:hypothetical protein
MNAVEFEDFLEGATWGAELAFGNADRNIKNLPKGNTWCTKEDYGMCNVGINIDPWLEFNNFGGEINVKPANSEEELYNTLIDLTNLTLPKGEIITYPTCTHIHMRIPKLLDNTEILKKLLIWGANWDASIFAKANCVYNIDQKLLNNPELNRYYTYHATVWDSFFSGYPNEALVRAFLHPRENTVWEMVYALHEYTLNHKIYYENKVMPRPIVNYGKIVHKEETVEFRGFFSTENLNKLREIVYFPRKYFEACLRNFSDPLIIVSDSIKNNWHGWGTEEIPINTQINWANTCRHLNNINDIKEYIYKLLERKEITIKDLNYPQYWIDQGFN